MRVYNSQWGYDNAEPPDDRNYRDELMYADFVEDVTLKLLTGRDQYGIDSAILLIELELAGGGYKLASKWVCERLSEEQFKNWIDDD